MISTRLGTPEAATLIEVGRRNQSALIGFLRQAKELRFTQRVAPLARQLLRAFPDDAAIQSELMHLFHAAGDGAAAVEASERAAALRPADLIAQLDHVEALFRVWRDREAADVIARAAADLELEGEELCRLGDAAMRVGGHEVALELYRRAADARPDDPHAMGGLAAAQRFLGQTEEAERSFDKLIALQPGNAEARYLRSDLRVQIGARNHIEDLRADLAGAARPQDKVLIGYALAKEMDDLGCYDQAFQHLVEAARNHRASIRYDVRDDERLMGKLAEEHSEPFAAGRNGSGGTQPLFVLGLPRSGTTLLERMLDQHSHVHSAGELTTLSDLIVSLSGSVASPIDRVGAALKVDMAQLGRLYTDRASAAREGARWVIDKMPLNFLNIGLIARALPGARVLHLERDPLDSCLAMYRTFFRRGYAFSYDLEELARYYVAYQRLMTCWREAFPGLVFSISYEALVSDPQKTLRQVCRHLEIDFEPAMLEFHRSRSASTTASASQVRRPLYETSVGRWRRYQAHLSPLIDQLRALGLKVGDT